MAKSPQEEVTYQLGKAVDLQKELNRLVSAGSKTYTGNAADISALLTQQLEKEIIVDISRTQELLIDIRQKCKD